MVDIKRFRYNITVSGLKRRGKNGTNGKTKNAETKNETLEE